MNPEKTRQLIREILVFAKITISSCSKDHWIIKITKVWICILRFNYHPSLKSYENSIEFIIVINWWINTCAIGENLHFWHHFDYQPTFKIQRLVTCRKAYPGSRKEKGRSIIRSSSDLDLANGPAFLAKREDYLSSCRQPR